MIDASSYCGILQIQGAGSGQHPDEHPLLKPVLDIGRSADCDLMLDDPRVSRRHARLSYAAQGFQIQDLGSANGTLVNGQPLPPRRPSPLSPGDVVQVGSFQLAIRLATPEAPPPPVLGERLRISAQPQPGLAVYTQGRLTKFPLEKPQMTLGRQADNDLVIPANVVSGHHARLEWIGHTYRIVDLGSTNGLVYNGQRVPAIDLADGDTAYITDQVAIRYLASIGLLPAVEKEQEVITKRLPTDEQPVRIGRANDNQIVLDHPQVSRYHAIVERMGVGRYRIRDLKSTNGVFVNNKWPTPQVCAWTSWACKSGSPRKRTSCRISPSRSIPRSLSPLSACLERASRPS
jgi:pSer/pThr/pTyr-binding forkhead associated (FHA) protein